MKLITEFVCETLECQRATIYAYDDVTHELWSQAASGSEIIFRVAIGSGLAGACAQNSHIINIQDAYNDRRFNKEYDLKTNFRTKSVLVVPILDKQGKLQGVIQAINKQGGSSGNAILSFSHYDIGLLKLIARISGLFLKSTINFTEQSFLTQHMKDIVQFGVVLNRADSMAQLFSIAEELIQKFYNSMQMRMYLFEPSNKNKYIRYSKENKKEVLEADSALIRFAFTGKVKKIRNPSQHPDYNKFIDLDSSLFLLIFPIIDVISGDTIGGYEVVTTTCLAGIYKL